MFKVLMTLFLVFIYCSFPVDATNQPFNSQNKIIFISTMPKSGSVYIRHVLHTATGFPNESISSHNFNNDTVFECLINQLKSTSCFTRGHINASKTNLGVLEKHFSKMMIHLRDPRQQLISWYHHVEKTPTALFAGWSSKIRPPSNYFNWSMEKKLDWQIENFLPCSIQWIQEWCHVIDTNKHIEFLITRFEDMKQNPEDFFNKISDFFGLSLTHLQLPEFKKNKLHHRKGEVAEWTYVLNDRQKKRVKELVPEALLQRFGWESF